jgi:hypothetical protein
MQQDRGTCAVAEQAGADQHAGIVVEVHRRAAHLDADGQYVLAGVGRQQRTPKLKVRQCRRAALADQIEGLHVGAQSQPFDHVTREPRAQVAGAGANDEHVDVGRLQPGPGQCAFGRLRGEQGRVSEEAPRERVRVDCEGFGKRVNGKSPRFDPVVAPHDSARDDVRALVELHEPVGAFECLKALSLGVARRRRGRADSAKVHDQTVLTSLHVPTASRTTC